LKVNDRDNLSLVVKRGGFAVRLADVDGRPAKNGQIERVCTFCRELPWKNDVFVKTDGFVDLCARKLEGLWAAQADGAPAFYCNGAVAFGDGLTDEPMFAVVNYGINVGNEASRAEERLRGHDETLDVLEWLVELRQRDDIDCCTIKVFVFVKLDV
jgi:hypothetical protein